jgi:hypothetical protein
MKGLFTERSGRRGDGEALNDTRKLLTLLPLKGEAGKKFRNNLPEVSLLPSSHLHASHGLGPTGYHRPRHLGDAFH